VTARRPIRPRPDVIAKNALWFYQSLERVSATQADLARHLRLAPSAVSRMLSGERQMKLLEAVQIANFLGVSQEEVLRYAGESRIPTPGGKVVAEILDRLIGEAERDERASFAGLARAAGLDPARDFIGAFLASLDFRDEDLRGFNFSDADLTGADFRRANLAGVRFEGAILTGAIGLSGQLPPPTHELTSQVERRMARAEPSGRRLSSADVSLVKGMLDRGDRHHDIAAWFGVNQGRIAEVKAGELHPEALPASTEELPPRGSPGRIARIAMQALDEVTTALEAQEGVQLAKSILDRAIPKIREER
jgi:uncharacterized protein YjbI with pentapeptide repeats